MSIFVLLNLEFKKIYNDLNKLIFKRKFILSYFLISTSFVFLYIGLKTMAFYLINFKSFSNLISILLNNIIIKNIVPIWIVYSILIGFIYNNFPEKFGYADIQILFLSTMDHRKIYLVKYLINIVKRVIVFAFIFYSISPIFYYLKINNYRTIHVFLVIFFSIEFKYAINDFIFLFKNKLRLIKCYLIYAFISIFLFLFFIIFLYYDYYDVIFNMFHNIIVLINLNNILNNYDIFMFLYILLILLNFLLSHNLILILAEKIYVLDYKSYFNINNRCLTSKKLIKSDILYFIIRDIIMNFREKFKFIMVNLIILFGTIFTLYNSIIIYNIYYYSDVFIFFIVFLFIICISWYSITAELINKEIRLFWLIKTSKISTSKLILSKYISSIFYSVIILLPIIIIFISNYKTNILLMLLVTLHSIIIYNVMGISVSTFFIDDYNNYFIDKFIYNLIQIIMTYIVAAIYIILYKSNLSLLLLITIINITMLYIENDDQKFYKILDFMTKFYIVSIIFLYVIGFLLIFIYSYKNYIFLRLLNDINYLLYFITTFMSTYNIIKILNSLTLESLNNHDHLI